MSTGYFFRWSRFRKPHFITYEEIRACFRQGFVRMCVLFLQKALQDDVEALLEHLLGGLAL